MHIVADENIPGVESAFGDAAMVTRVTGRNLQPNQLAHCDVLLVRSVTRVDEALLASTPVRFVGTATSGMDHIDREYLAQSGIGFAHAPGSNANSVVEYVLAAIADTDDYLEQLLAGGRVGIVGYGHIGKALVARLHALGIGSVISDPWLAGQCPQAAASLEEVLACKVVSLHPELTSAEPWPSYHLLADAQLRRLAKGQLLINASRGPVIDNRALLHRLQAPAAPDVVLDVWEHEPMVDAGLLARVRRGSAHIAGYSYDGKLLATRMLRDAVVEHLGVNIAADNLEAGEEQTTITLAGFCTVADTLRELIRQCYSIEEDDALLRVAVNNQDETHCRQNFDALRRQYRCRRELLGRRVNLAGNRDLLGIAQALGCVADNSRE